MFERVSGVIGGADDCHFAGGEDALGGEGGGGELGVGEFPDLGRVGLVDEQLDAEVAAELEVRPVVKRITHQLRNDAAEGEELVVVGGGAGDEVLINAGCAHGPPLVVIAAEPDFGEVAELFVRRDLIGREMAVVVVDRLCLCDVVVEAARGLGSEQEVVVEEGGHGDGKRLKD